MSEHHQPEEGVGPDNAGPTPPEGSFGDEAAEMANETEVENAAADMVEEGGPLAPDAVEDELTTTRMALEEMRLDLQRLQAEYLNYKRRVDRDRELVKENARYAALAPIVDVLDTIDRAREHGDLDPGFQTTADQLTRVVAAAGLTKFGEIGDAFDPNLHEALSHLGTDPEVSTTTVKVVAKAGYRIGDRVVRAAQVLVVDPE